MIHSKLEETSLGELSEDVIHHIFLLLPHKSLGNCKLVSKLWNSIISNPEFAKAHLRFANLNCDSPSFLALQKYNTISSLKFDSSIDMVTKSDAYLVPLDQQFEVHKYDGHCFLVGSCDGLVCLYHKKKGKPEDMMHVWNPTINKSIQIPLPVEQGLTYLLVESCWFGFVTSVNTYKVFLVYEVYQPAFVERKYIYSFRDHKWREMRETNEVGGKEVIYYPSFASGSKSAVMNESIHYLVGNHIHKFDLVAEIFERIPLSIKPDLLPRYCKIMLGVIGEDKCMCTMVVHYFEEWIFDLWILEEYNKWDSWKRLYKINLQTEIASDCTHFFGFTESGHLCVEGEKGLKLIDPSQNPPLYVNVNTCSLPVYQVMDHVESLVSPISLP